jgi:hypothetical protein
MARRIALVAHLIIEELEGRCPSMKDSVEHSLWLLAREWAAKEIAAATRKYVPTGVRARRRGERGNVRPG